MDEQLYPIYIYGINSLSSYVAIIEKSLHSMK